jgi:hypothetical protein
MQTGPNATVLTALGQVDVVQRLPGMPEWPQLVEEAEVYEIDAMRVQVINGRTVIGLKRRRGRTWTSPTSRRSSSSPSSNPIRSRDGTGPGGAGCRGPRSIGLRSPWANRRVRWS